MTVLSSLLTLVFAVAIAQGQGKPLTADDLLQMKNAGFDEQTTVKAIQANGVSIDTSVQGLITLKSTGLSEKVISAALNAASGKGAEAGLPQEVGVYIKVQENLQAIEPEILTLKSGGLLKTKVNGSVKEGKSKLSLSEPIEIILRTSEGTVAAEYQLLRLDAKKDRREFQAASVGLGGISTGTDKNAVKAKFEKIGKNSWKAVLPDLKPGEYGILPPGAISTANLAAIGKLYTFSVK